MSSLHRTLATTAIFATAVSAGFARSETTSESLTASQPRVSSVDETTQRGYLILGELMVFPAADQGLPQGFALVSESTLDKQHQVVRLDGQADVVSEGDELVALMSRSLSFGEGQLAISSGEGMLELGDLALAISKDGWNIVSLSSDWMGRPVFEFAETSRQVYRTDDGFSITGELVLSPTVLEAFGLHVESAPVVGAITLIASPMFDPAVAVIANAPAALGSIGPDVIVSNIGTTFGEYGAVGDIGAYAFTTVSCNVGDALAIWIDTGAQDTEHPVIGQELYRYKVVNGAGRMEQIGQAWLKHGFCAADACGCTSINPNGENPVCATNGSCDWLGFFATDTYSDGLNASQGNLGPRSEIQPWTGDFPYPYLLNGCGSSTAICKRLQVDKDDLDPAQNAGATFWGESVYITTDEALNYIRHNNYSYRQTTVGGFSGGQYNLSFSGATVPLQPALNRWAVSESGVTLVNVDVPGDGRFVLGYKVTDLGGGQHHYEYALLNMNSDRSGQAVSVPLPSGITTSNVGFHDIDYHSGEPYSNTDWTPTVTPNTSVSWAGVPYATNVNANALRWSTTYNFRFDADAAPQPGVITLTLFKPGSPTTILINADVPGGQTCAVSTYCTTSLTQNFCQPQMTGAGVASASASSGFTLDVAGVDGNRAGLFYYGQAPAAVVWGPGSASWRCVASPSQRLPSQNSGGTQGGCDGVFTVDWNNWRSTHPAALGSPFAQGQVYYSQCWFRDPSAVKGTNLTNGVQFTLCP